MTLFPIHRPRIGLSFTAHSLCLAEITPWWQPGRWQASLARSCERILSPGLLAPSDTAPNIADTNALATEIRRLVGAGGPVPVALSLPHQSAQVAIFEFETLPRRASECESLLRWRFHEEWNLPPGDSRVVFRAFRNYGRSHGPTHGGASRPGEPSGPRVRMLAMNIRRDILRQYERVCEDAGLLPATIGIASLQLFDLCRTVMRPADELFFVHRSPDGFAFFAIRQGTPVYLRSKSIRQQAIDLPAELTRTLQYYDEHVVQTEAGSDGVRQLVLLGDELGSGWPDGQSSEPSLAYSTSKGAHRVRVVKLGWPDVPISSRRGAEYPVSGLPALAGILAA